MEADVSRDSSNRVDGDVFGSLVQAGRIGALHLPAPRPKPPRPAQAPPAPARFINRVREIAAIDQWVAQPAPSGATVVWLAGMHGVGKTAIGRLWAQRNGDRFDDGVLHVDYAALRSQGLPSVSDVIGGLLRALGVPEEVIPASLAERTGLYRSQTANRRLLMLVDDAEHAAQVQPLVPNGQHSVVLVTARASLDELLVDGAKRVRLRPFRPPSSRALLVEMIGAGRVDAEPDHVARLVEICGGLPVALRVCGARLSIHDRRPVSWLVGLLEDGQKRLSEISTDHGRSLAAVFDEAYATLPAGAAQLYRFVGMSPALRLTHAATAAMTNVPVATASAYVDVLLRAELADEDHTGRLQLHDLVRAHAAGLGAANDGDEFEAGLRRLVEWYLAACRLMDRAMIPDRLRLGSADGVPGEDTLPQFGSTAEAMAWFEAERSGIMAIVRAAYDREWFGLVWEFGEALFLGYHNHKHHDEAQELYERAAESAARVGYRDAEARLRGQLARVAIDRGDFERATAAMDAAGLLTERTENRNLAASITEWSGVLHVAQGEFEAGIAAFERARSSFEELGNVRGVVLQDYHLGRALILSGSPDSALAYLESAASLVDRERDQLTDGRIQLRLGQAYRSAGDVRAATAALAAAVTLMRTNDAPLYEATAHEELGLTWLHDPERAAQHLTAAAEMYASLSSPREARVRRVLADLPAPPA